MICQPHLENGERKSWEAKTVVLRTPLKYFRLKVKKIQPGVRGVERKEGTPWICHRDVVIL